MATCSSPSAVGDARIIADLLHRMEDLLAATFATGGELTAALARVRAKRSLSRVVGHSADTSIARAMALSSEAASQVIDAHRLLDRLAPRLGIDATSFGDGSKDPDVATAPIGQLRAVG